jgi:hypothetical protein
MPRTITQFKALSGSNYVYFTSEEAEPSNISQKTIVGTTTRPLELHDDRFGPVELWTLDGQAGMTGSVEGIVFDESVGSAGFGYSPIVGRQALYCDGVSRFSAAATGSLQITGDVTVMALVYPSVTASSAQMDLLNCRGSVGNVQAHNTLYGLSISTAQQAFFGFFETGSGDNHFILSSTPYVGVQNGQWSHLAYLRDGSTNKLFINGILVFSSASGNPDGGTSSFLSLGGPQPAATQKFHGWISSVIVYNKALTDAQVRGEALRTLGDLIV